MRKNKTRVFGLCAALLIFIFIFAGRAGAAISRNTVQNAWKKIAAAAAMEPITITYENDQAPNAWVKFQSASNFSVHVTQGLLQVLNTPEEIAGILGHEVGHVKCGHYNEGVKRSIGWGVLGALLGRAGGIAEIAGNVGMSLAESGFSREQEVEADDYGMDLAVKAGYSPWGLYYAMKSFKDNGFKTEPSGFNSHPPTDRRLLHLEERARKIEPVKPAQQTNSKNNSGGSGSGKNNSGKNNSGR